MKKFIIGVLMLSIGLGGYFSDNFLKYSTFYTSVSLESPFTPKQKFAVETHKRELLKKQLKRLEVLIIFHLV